MYSLSCPACSTTVDRPFVRVGARAVCGKCEHAYQIAGQQVDHKVNIPAFEAGQNPLLLGSSTAKPPPPMKPQPKAPPPPTPVPEPEPEPQRVASPPPSPSVAKMIARKRAKRRRKQQLITLLVITGLLMVAIGVVLFVYNKAQNTEDFDTPIVNQAGNNADGSIGNTGAQVGQPKQPELPLLQGEALASPLWEEIYAAYESSDQPDALQLTGGRIVDMNNVESIYIAQVDASNDELIELAYIKLMLVDTSDMVFAQTEVPMMLVGGPFAEDMKRRRLRVRVPRRLADRTINVHQSVEIIQEIKEGKQITDLLVEQAKAVDRPTLNIKAYNPLTTTMQRAIFYIEALDNAGEVVARFRVNWAKQVQARERFEFNVNLQTTRQWGVADWRVFGVAEPQEMFGP